MTSNIYRLQLSGTWPAHYETLDTGISSAIFAFTENPWTNAIWFSSSDFFGSGNNFYLYEIDAGFTMATLRSSFEKKGDSSGNGPIIFENETTLLYGEAVFGGNGYFHQVNTDTGAVIQADYLTFAGGLGDATYGYNNRIYVTSGGGKSIFEIDGTQQTLLATTDDEARGITFDGTSLFISAMVPFSGSADDGEISLLELWQTRLAGVPADQHVDDSVDLNCRRHTGQPAAGCHFSGEYGRRFRFEANRRQPGGNELLSSSPLSRSPQAPLPRQPTGPLIFPSIW